MMTSVRLGDCKKRLATMDYVRDYLYEQWPREDPARSLVVDITFGEYSKPTFYVVSLEGSPPRGTLFIDPYYRTVSLYDGGKMKKARVSIIPIALRFIDEWCNDKKDSFTIYPDGSIASTIKAGCDL